MEEKTEDVIEVQENTKVDDERKWCVYIHTSPSEKKYIGITSQDAGDRWRNGSGYKENQTAMFRAIQKYKDWENDWTHEIIATNLTEQEAKEKEIELIALYKTNCSKYNHPAYGYNMTDGGDGTLGHIVLQETRNKISEKMKGRFVGENHPMYGISPKERMDEKTYIEWLKKIHTEEAHRKIKEANKGNKNCGCSGEKHYLYGKKMSDEHREKVTKHLTGFTNPRALPVYCIELNKIFWGAEDACQQLKINRGDIGGCCKGKRPKSAGKHPITGELLHWKYVYDQEQKDGTIIQGAIALGYITQQQVDEYLNNLKQKEID